jgi:hypothetical protein
MLRSKGRHLPLSLCRRFIGDLLHFASRVHSASVERRMNLAALVQARRLATPKPAWSAIFLKAYALVAARHPELRRSFMKFPWPHLYEHPESVATISVPRRLGGEDALFFAQLRAPDQGSLTEIGDYLRRCREEPLTSIGSFRRMLRLSRLPWLLRRSAWWLGLNVNGDLRARYFGTFGLSVIAGLGANQYHTASPMTSLVFYGQFEPDGILPVRLTFDHRVFDGALVARVLCELERILLGEILDEVRRLGAAAA